MVPLPPYARRVEYLESTGTQWIDTGVVPTGATGIDCDFAMLNTAQNFSPVFWSRGSSATDRAFCFEGERVTGDAKGQARWDYGSYGPRQMRNVIEQGAKTTASVRNGTLTVAGSVLTRAEQTFTGAGSIILFNFCNYVNGERQMISADVQPIRIYSCAIYNGTPVRSFIPCRILDTGYLWDEVEGKFYGNQGTGDFVLGPDVREGVVPTRLNPFGVGRRQEKIRRVEYLESTGEQFVDTGVVPSSSFGFEMVFAETVRQTNTNAGIFGREITDGNTTRCALFTDWTHHPVFYGDDKVTFDSVLPVNQATSFGASASTGECHVGNNSLNGFTLNGLYTDTVRIFPNQAKPAIGRVYSCQIFVGSTLVRDFFPVAIGPVGYLLDRVSGRLFGNHGTGVFVVGPDTVSSENVSTISMKGINI